MKNYLPPLLALVLLTSGAAFAQSPSAPDSAQTPAMHQHHPRDPARQARHLSKKLGLSSDQSAQLQPILADRDQKMQALATNTSLDPKSMHQQRRAIAQDADQKLSAILTPAQQQQYAAMKAAHHHGHKGADATQQTAPSAA